MERNKKQAFSLGLKGKCPNCSNGKIFKSFLKVADKCENCGQELHHHRADDLPAYLVVFLVGHIVVPIMLVFLDKYPEWPNWLHMAIWLPLFVIISLLIVQPIKGAIVAYQWANKMHGFAQEVSEKS